MLQSSCLSSKSGLEVKEIIGSYTFEDLDKLMEISPKNIVVFIYTDWCKYCKNMEQTTFKNQKVQELLKNEFYFVSFNGEQKESIVFNENQFDYKPRGRHNGTHELAMALGSIDGELSYPIFLILNESYEVIFQYNAFIDANQLVQILNSV